MSHHRTSWAVIGAAALLAFAPEASRAQAKPKPASSKRIPITKESAGEVVRVDTVTRVDTLQITNTIYRTDTITVNTVRVDTVTLVPRPAPIHLPNGFYVGLAAGSSAPDGSLYIPNGVGYMGQLQLGWQHAKQVLGARISGGYTGLGQDSQFSVGDNGQLWTLSTDAKFNLPMGHVFGLTPRLNAYGIGGWTYTWFRNLPHRVDADLSGAVVTNNGTIVTTNNDLDINHPAVIVLGSDSWTGRNGWDAGGGLSLMWGRSEVFAEARVLGFSIENGGNARQIPIVLGFNWY
jgi:hypothetical protein